MAKSKITSEMLGGSIKTTSAPSRRSRTDIAFIAGRILPVADIILTFVPSVNPARISSMINRNLSLFTCGIFLSEMSTIKQLINIKEAAAAFAATASFIGRGDGTRTHGLFVPNEALYQTEPHLGNMNIISYRAGFVKPFLKKFAEVCFAYESSCGML